MWRYVQIKYMAIVSGCPKLPISSNSLEGLFRIRWPLSSDLLQRQQHRNTITPYTLGSLKEKDIGSLEQSMCRLPKLSSSPERLHRVYHLYSPENTATLCSVFTQRDHLRLGI